MIDLVSLPTLLPFILVIAIVYGALETARIFNNKAVRTIISVVMGFFAVSNYQLVQAINSYLPYAAIIFILVFLAGYAKRSMGGGEKDNTIIIILMVLGLLFVASYSSAQGGLYNYSEFLWLIGVVIIAAIFYAAYKMR